MTIKKVTAQADPSDTDYWCTAAAGCFFLARDTGRIMFCHRAPNTEAPNTWAAWGGGMEKDESPMRAMKREIQEETNTDPEMIEDFHHLYSHEVPESGFQYHSYLAIVPTEFVPVFPKNEAQGYRWVDYGDWPTPLHPGVEYMFDRTQALDKIQQIKQRMDMKPGIQRVMARLQTTAAKENL